MKPITYETLTAYPYDVMAEQSVIGALILDNAAASKVAWLRSEDFYQEDHRLIFNAAMELAANATPRDVITLQNYLKEQGKLDDAGGLAYLATLAKDTPSAANVKAYARVVREQALKRQLIDIGQQLQSSAIRSAPNEAAAHAMSALIPVTRNDQGKPCFSDAKQGLQTALEGIETRSKLPVGEVMGWKTGINAIDRMLSGLEKGKQYLIAGRPGMGKSTFAFNIAETVALNGGSVMIFSVEMPKESCWNKMLSSVGRVDFDRIKHAQLITEGDWSKLSRATQRLDKTSMRIDDSGGISPAYIRSALTQFVADSGRPVDLVVVDYLQIMTASAGNDISTENALLTAISREMMAIKKEFDCPVVLLSQLNRSVEQRPNKRPMLADLRGSGSLEQDADAVIMLYRDEYYNQGSADKGLAEISIVKQREGELGTVKATFLGKYQRFENYEPRYEELYRSGRVSS